ncbi:MAG TPA: hypothetical protein DEB06_09300 [Phycisphaerales bacterium]|nr:hypothetical protein [Phycisphaerales bacterium]
MKGAAESKSSSPKPSARPATANLLKEVRRLQQVADKMAKAHREATRRADSTVGGKILARIAG